MLELLEDRRLMAVAGLVANPDGLPPDSLITAVNGTVINIDVLANDVSPNGTPTIVGFTQGSGGVASLNSDNTVAYNAYSVGANAFAYEITDGVRYATTSVYIDVIPSASELYAKYQADVSVADEAYEEAILDAAAIRQSDIAAARATAQAAAAQLYADYQFAVAQAVDVYGIAVTDAETTYQGAVAIADATYQADTDAAQVIYDAAIATSQTAYSDAVTAAETAYLAGLLAADTAYDAANDTIVPPLQAALTQANDDADNAAAVLASAEAALSLAIEAALQDGLAPGDAAYDAAVDPYQAARDGAAAANVSALAARSAADEAWIDAVDAATSAREQAIVDTGTALDNAYVTADDAWSAAFAANDARLIAADLAWTNAEKTAWNGYSAWRADADAIYAGTEEIASRLDVNGVADLEAGLAATEVAYQNEFETRTTLAVVAWNVSEENAANSYFAGLNNLLVPPAPEARLTDPPAVEVAAVAPSTPLPMGGRFDRSRALERGEAYAREIAELRLEVSRNATFLFILVGGRLILQRDYALAVARAANDPLSTPAQIDLIRQRLEAFERLIPGARQDDQNARQRLDEALRRYELPQFLPNLP